MVDGGTSPNRHAGVDGDVGANVDLCSDCHRLSNPAPCDSLAVLHLVPDISSDDGDVGANPCPWPNCDECCVVDVAVMVDADFVLDAKVVAIRRSEWCFNLYASAELAHIVCAWDNEMVRSILGGVNHFLEQLQLLLVGQTRRDLRGVVVSLQCRFTTLALVGQCRIEVVKVCTAKHLGLLNLLLHESPRSGLDRVIGR